MKGSGWGLQVGLLLLGVLVVLWLGPPAAHAQGAAGGVWDQPAGPPLAAGPRPVTSAAGEAHAPYILPPRPSAPALGVAFADGREARWIPLLDLGGSLYWPLEEACLVLDGFLDWNPRCLSGRLRVDSLAFRFVVGSEMIACGLRTVQLPAPVLYARNRLLLPLGFVGRIVDPFLGDHFTFQPDSLVLTQKPAGETLGGLQIQQVDRRTYLRWQLETEPEVRLWTDGADLLVVELPGVFVDPRTPPAPPAVRGARLHVIRPSPQGTRFGFLLDPEVVGWRSQWRPGRRELRLVLTRDPQDLGRWRTYLRWPAAFWQSRPPGERAIVLVLPTAEEGVEAGRSRRACEAAHEYVCALGEQLQEMLEDRGLPVVALEDLGHPTSGGWAAAANARGGVLALCLRTDVCGDSLRRGYRIVTAVRGEGEGPLYRLEPLAERVFAETAGLVVDSTRARPLSGALAPWEAVTARHRAANEDLAWFLAAHIGMVDAVAAGGRRPPRVSHQRWPAAELEGLDMAGAILYIGGTGGEAPFPTPQDWERMEPLTEAIALALEAFTLDREERR